MSCSLQVAKKQSMMSGNTMPPSTNGYKLSISILGAGDIKWQCWVAKSMSLGGLMACRESTAWKHMIPFITAGQR